MHPNAYVNTPNTLLISILCGVLAGGLFAENLGAQEPVPQNQAKTESPETSGTPKPAEPDTGVEIGNPQIIRQILNREPVVITPENANAKSVNALVESEIQKLPHTVWKILAHETQITPLILAAAMDNPTLTKTLIEKGAKKTHATHPRKVTPIQVAFQAKSLKTAQALFNPEAEQFKIDIDLTEQRLTGYANNVEIFDSAISSGDRGHPTPMGIFIITEKYGKKKISTLYDANMPFFMRLNLSAVGIHAGELPGYPASKGCIRMPYAKAQELSRLMPLGTLVTIRSQNNQD